MTRPNFLIAGAPRSGTTSLFNYLNQHPLIELSRRKEPAHFHFAYTRPDFEAMAKSYGQVHLIDSIANYERTRRNAIIDPDLYASLWTSGDHVTLRGEATPTYFYDPRALEQIVASLPECRVILLLRNPTHRAYSQYLQYLRNGFEDRYDFEAALAQEPVEIPTFWWGRRRYLRMGLYSSHVARCIDLFSRARLGVFLYEDLVANSQRVVEEVVSFLGVEPGFGFDTSTQHNAAFVPTRSAALRLAQSEGKLKAVARVVMPDRLRNRLYRGLVSRRGTGPPPLNQETRERLTEFFADDIVRLEELLSRDLSSWKSA